MNEPLVTAREIADHLHLTTRQVMSRFNAGVIPGFRLYGERGPVRFRMSEIEAWLERGREKVG